MIFLMEIARHFAKIMDSLLSFVILSVLTSVVILGAIWLKGYVSNKIISYKKQ